MPKMMRLIITELATIAVPLVGDTIGETYLNQQQILTIAAEHGADAIHPGFGFYSVLILLRQ